MRSRLELLGSEEAKEWLNAGILSPDRFSKYIRYSIFVDFLKHHDKATAIQLAADHCHCSEREIYRAIEFLTSQ